MQTQEAKIQIIFRIDTKYGTFQDALWFTQGEYDKLSQGDIDTMKQERVDNWIKVVSAPITDVSEEEKLVQINDEMYSLTLQMQMLQTQKELITKAK